jgi:hypothetical protein
MVIDEEFPALRASRIRGQPKALAFVRRRLGMRGEAMRKIAL